MKITANLYSCSTNTFTRTQSLYHAPQFDTSARIHVRICAHWYGLATNIHHTIPVFQRLCIHYIEN